MKARLTIESGDARPETLELQPTQAATLGRSRDNTVVLRSEHASRLHAKVLFEDGRWQVQDFSLNGTFVAGERIQQRVDLNHGEDIRIGEIRLRFTFDDLTPSSHSVRLSNSDRRDRQSHSGTISTSRLHSADMSVLCAFMAAQVGTQDSKLLLREALELFLQQSGANATGYLSPDPADPLPKIVQPEKAGFDHAFSRHMTRKAQRDGKTVWLATDVTESRPADSLQEITDALCVPVKFDGVAMGMVHATKKGGYFTDRDVRFAEAMADFLAGCLRGLQRRHNLEVELARLRTHPPVVEELIGDSAPMVQLRQRIAQVGSQPVPALVRGEIGVPLEVVALGVHHRGPSARGPFVALNCASLPPTLLEAELFGPRPTQPGAPDRPPLVAIADEGTLYIDEIGEMSLEAQSRILRLIDDKCYRPAGSTSEVRAEVRVIAGTRVDLEAAVADGLFRRQLLDRLERSAIDVPSLRSHLDDVPYLVQYFLDKLATESRLQASLTADAMAKLQSYLWPGNHRQLRAELEAAVFRAGQDVIDASDILVGCEKMLLLHH